MHSGTKSLDIHYTYRVHISMKHNLYYYKICKTIIYQIYKYND